MRRLSIETFDHILVYEPAFIEQGTRGSNFEWRKDFFAGWIGGWHRRYLHEIAPRIL